MTTDVNDMIPKPEDGTISIPAAFDYRGGRSESIKNKIIIGIGSVVIPIIFIVIVISSNELEIWQKFLYSILSLYAGLWTLRYIVLDELYFSSIFEALKAKDYTLELPDIWQIFDIDFEYPYTCYFKNGYKGIFVRMEKDTITGKPDGLMYIHYEAISEAYNIAHSFNMNLVHIDYMDNVGNDVRLQNAMDDLDKIKNPDMQEMMADLYQHLQSEMSRQYTTFDVYLFLSKDSAENLLYNVQDVVGEMLGGNYITYKILNRAELGSVCKSLFNMHEFSVVDACEALLSSTSHSGVIPIKVRHADGTELVLNKTQFELQQEYAERERQQLQKKKSKKRNKEESVEEILVNIKEGDEIDLFDDN